MCGIWFCSTSIGKRLNLRREDFSFGAVSDLIIADRFLMGGGGGFPYPRLVSDFFREKYLKPHFGNVSWEGEL